MFHVKHRHRRGDMPRKASESQNSIARFFEQIESHMDDNKGIFMDGDLPTLTEVRVVQRELRHLAATYRERAELFRSRDN